MENLVGVSKNDDLEIKDKILFDRLIQISNESLRNDTNITSFYNPFFSTEADTKIFISQCTEDINRVKGVKKMMLLTKWLTDIADGLEKVKPGRPALQLIFLISLGEGITKLATNHSNEGGSKTHVKAFFEQVSQNDEKNLRLGFLRCDFLLEPIDLNTIVNYFYSIRNAVLHTGRYFDFTLPENRLDEFTWHITTINTEAENFETVQTRLCYRDIRDIFVRTAVSIIRLVLDGKSSNIKTCRYCPTATF